MTEYFFQRESEDGLIIAGITIDNKVELKMVLDIPEQLILQLTAMLCIYPDELKDNIGKVEIETANGIIETEVFSIQEFSSLGLLQKTFTIQVYDFLAHGIFSDFNGLLGLDFLKIENSALTWKER